MKWRRRRTDEERFFAFVVVGDANGCWPWNGHLNEHGYGKFWHKGQNGLAPRASYDMFVGPIPHGLYVLHSCDVPCCVNPDHLFVGTQRDNVHDMEQKNRSRHPEGADHGRAKITESDVRAIRLDSRSQAVLAKLYDMTKTNIRAIKKRKTWKHVV